MELAFDIPSDFSAGRDAERRIMEIVRGANFDPDSTFAIRIALEEALVNAIKHGNGLDASKTVHVHALVSKDQADITIEDQGIGFDKDRVPDPTATENLCRPSGRGILLIESYMTSARWDRGGRRLRMIKENVPGQLPRQ